MFFFFNDTPTTEIYTLSLHDALPIYVYVRSSTTSASRKPCSTSPCSMATRAQTLVPGTVGQRPCRPSAGGVSWTSRSEEHTSELQSQSNLVCRLLLDKTEKAECTLSD